MIQRKMTLLSIIILCMALFLAGCAKAQEQQEEPAPPQLEIEPIEPEEPEEPVVEEEPEDDTEQCAGSAAVRTFPCGHYLRGAGGGTYHPSDGRV